MSIPDFDIFEKMTTYNTGCIVEHDPPKPFVDDKGIWIPVCGEYQLVIPKDLFIEAYNKWIKGASSK